MSVGTIKAVDKYAGGAVLRVLSFLKKERDASIPSRILVIQLWGIGETVLTIPALEKLRELYPKAHIDVLVTARNKEVYANQRCVDSVIEINAGLFAVMGFCLRHANSYDLAIDMEEYLNVSALICYFCAKRSVGYAHGSRSFVYDVKVNYDDRTHASEAFLDLVKALGGEGKITALSELMYSKGDMKSVEITLSSFGVGNSERLVVIAAGSAESARCRIWPHERYASLCDEILAKYANTKIMLIGVAQEREENEKISRIVNEKDRVINAAGSFSLPEVFALMKKTTLFIGNDSGPMHVAAAQGVPTIGLFGPNLPARFGPVGKGNVGVYKKDACDFSPCINVHLGQVPDCLYAKNSPDYQKCMKAISVEDVFLEVRKKLGRH